LNYKKIIDDNENKFQIKYNEGNNEHNKQLQQLNIELDYVNKQNLSLQEDNEKLKSKLNNAIDNYENQIKLIKLDNKN
jgi:hypothetical protein